MVSETLGGWYMVVGHRSGGRLHVIPSPCIATTTTVTASSSFWYYLLSAAAINRTSGRYIINQSQGLSSLFFSNGLLP